MSSASYLLLGFWDMNKTWKEREYKREKNVTAQSQLTNKRKRNVKKTHKKGDGPQTKRKRKREKNAQVR